MNSAFQNSGEQQTQVFSRDAKNSLRELIYLELNSLFDWKKGRFSRTDRLSTLLQLKAPQALGEMLMMNCADEGAILMRPRSLRTNQASSSWITAQMSSLAVHLVGLLSWVLNTKSTKRNKLSYRQYFGLVSVFREIAMNLV